MRWIFLLTLMITGSTHAKEWASHPPARPLPIASKRPLEDGPVLYVDAGKGDDKAGGSMTKPWRTLGHAMEQLQPGDTLCLRGGTYYETVVIRKSGAKDKPITIRGYPGELAIIDAGYREFFEEPEKAWVPVGKDEYRSVKTYKTGGNFGRFGDSMIPFQRYRNLFDLRSTNELWNKKLSNRSDDPTGIYAGPGTHRDRKTGHIHIRLAHTKLAGLGEHAYRGETDPRRIPLVIAGSPYTLRMEGKKHIRLMDLVLRGASTSAIHMERCEDIVLDGLTLYGSGSALRLRPATRVKVLHCALRGHGAPWHARGHHKDRAGAGYLVIAQGDEIEIAHCELTDHHDGVAMTKAENVRFHHNLADNFNDDGLEPGPKRKSGRIEIYENHFGRALTWLTLHGKMGEPVRAAEGSGVYVYRNLFDLRRGVYGYVPAEADPSGAYLNRQSRVCGDHGSPIWPVMYVYHNTFLLPSTSWRGYYGFGLAQHTRGTTRRVFNNIFAQTAGLPGLNFPSVTDDFHADHNLLWSFEEGPSRAGSFFDKYRGSKTFRESRKVYAPGLGAGDRFANPRFQQIEGALDVRLRAESPALDAGPVLPKSWPDSRRAEDGGKPDLGMLPMGAEPPRVGPLRGTGRSGGDGRE